MPELSVEEQALQNELQPSEQPKEQVTASETPSSTPKVESKVDDPEYDLGIGEDGQPLKLKRSQILEFKKGTMLQSDYTKKTQEISAQKKELEEMYRIVDHLKSNPKKAERIIAILDEKEVQAEEKIDEIDEVLKQLDPNDPYAKTLRALKLQNQNLLKTTQEMQAKLNGFEQKAQTFEEREQIKQAEVTLTKALDDMTKDYKFEDDDDKADWRTMVLTHLVNNPKKYESEEDFITSIKQVGKAQYDSLVKRIERITGRYVKSKTGVTPSAHPSGQGAKPLSKKPSMGGKGTEDNLQEVLEEALKGEMDTNQE